jgi:hypothetical protein
MLDEIKICTENQYKSTPLSGKDGWQLINPKIHFFEPLEPNFWSSNKS